MNPDDDKEQADFLLHDLATELRRVPMCESTRKLHLRALALKREVSGWTVLQPAASERAPVIAEIRELCRTAERFRQLPTGRQLAYEAASRLV
jgi:hypothetical protein